MAKTGRNERCPCGSGKKYKACCLPADQQQERTDRARFDLMRDVFEWLEERHEGFQEQALADLLGDGYLGVAQRLEAEFGRSVMREHWLEWALSEARVGAEGNRKTALELLAEEGAPELAGDTGTFLLALARAPLRAWHVESCTDTATLRDVVSGEEVELREPGLNAYLVEGDIVGLRIFEHGGRRQRFWTPWFCGQELPGALQGTPPETLARTIANHWLEHALETLDAPGEGGGVWRSLHSIVDLAALTAELEGAGAQRVDGDIWIFLETEQFEAEVEVVETDLVVTTATEAEATLAAAYVAERWGAFLQFESIGFDGLGDDLDWDEERP